MSGRLFKRPSVQDREMDRIQRKVSPLDGGTPYLDQLYKPARRGAAPSEGGDRRDGDTTGAGRGRHRKVSLFTPVHWSDFWPDVFGGGEDRLTAYLSGSFETARPVRYQRRIRRNRLVVVAIFLGMVLIWATGRWG